jgi:hypothetical protein
MIQLIDQPFKCVHCNKSFMRERTLISHMCEGRRRSMQKNEKRVQAGLMAYNRFFQLTQNAKKPKTYDEFCNTSYYNAFVKFGSFINNVKPLYPEKFVDYVIKSGVKLDHWCRDELYETYLYDMIKVEPVDSAVERSLKTFIEWGDKHSIPFKDYFDLINLNQAVQDVLNGKISPWIILNSASGQAMLNKMNDEQLNMIAPALEIQFWIRKFKTVPADVALVKEICKEIGIK